LQVDLELSGDQELFSETTRRFLSANAPISRARELVGDPVGFDRKVWAQGAELGWLSMMIPEKYEGGSISGEGASDLSIVMEELGRSVFPGPVLPSNVVAFALANFGSDELREAHLPSLAAGRSLATWATAEGDDRWGGEAAGLLADPSGGDYVLTGVKSPVQDGHVADLFLVTADTPNGLAQFLVESGTPGVVVEPMESLDLARRFSLVRFEGVRVPSTSAVGEVGDAGSAIERQLAFAVAMQCAETVGATDRAWEITLDYVRQRKSFGRPIGSYQALKHRLVDMLLWLESSKAATVAAVQAVQFDADAPVTASVAKSYVGERCPMILRECLQMHGGIGFTWEHDLHFYMRRVESNSALFGNPDYHRDRLATVIGM
jgi:alkylation response protein AidB-like acyl-CoA dehydrogenase